MNLEQKVALVTGAGQGIGKGIALALAREGCRVVVTDINKDTADSVTEEINNAGGQAVSANGDVSNREEVKNMFACSSVFGPVEILVNNAGVFPMSPFGETSQEEWEYTFNVNVKGVFNCSQEALYCMPEGGRIISISSIASRVGIPGLVNYCASKAAVEGFTRALAVELADRNITVNAIAPGSIVTPGADGLSDEALAQTIANVPLRRRGSPEDIANAVLYLASPQGHYVTGQVMVVDGGWIVRP